jgi:hypothetical protein
LFEFVTFIVQSTTVENIASEATLLNQKQLQSLARAAKILGKGHRSHPPSPSSLMKAISDRLAVWGRTITIFPA